MKIEYRYDRETHKTIKKVTSLISTAGPTITETYEDEDTKPNELVVGLRSVSDQIRTFKEDLIHTLTQTAAAEAKARVLTTTITEDLKVTLGDLQYDEDGELIMEYLTEDAIDPDTGEVMLDSEGKPIREFVLDENGDRIEVPARTSSREWVEGPLITVTPGLHILALGVRTETPIEGNLFITIYDGININEPFFHVTADKVTNDPKGVFIENDIIIPKDIGSTFVRTNIEGDVALDFVIQKDVTTYEKK